MYFLPRFRLGGGILLNGTTGGGGDNFSHNIVRDAVSMSKRRALQESKQPEISMMQSTQVRIQPCKSSIAIPSS